MDWTFAIGLVLALVAIGFTVLALGDADDFIIAKSCFLLAGLIFAAQIVLWGGMRKPQSAMVWIVVFLSCGLTGLLGLGAVRYVDRKRAKKEAAEPLPKRESSSAAQPSVTAVEPTIQRVALITIATGDVEYFPDIQKYGIKVEMILDNETTPDAELQNVSGQVWTESKYLVATLRRTKFDHPWERDRDRLRYRIWEPVLPKMSHEWLPTLVFALPLPGEQANFGAEIVSKTTDFRQYRWWIANENGKGILHGGDATPKNTLEVAK